MGITNWLVRIQKNPMPEIKFQANVTQPCLLRNRGSKLRSQIA